MSDGVDADSGMQRDRTSLAWDRTGLAFMVVGGLIVRVGGEPYDDLRHAPGILAVVLGASLIALEARGPRRGSEEPRARPGLIRLVGAMTVGLTIAALVVILTAGQPA